MTKKVRFNAHGSVHLIPDDEFIKIQAKADDLEGRNMSERQSYVNSVRWKFRTIDVKPGDIIEVPDHYYESFKDQVTSVPISFDHYTDETGLRSSFNMQESIRHRDITAEEANAIKQTGKVIREVKLFELVVGSDGGDTIVLKNRTVEDKPEKKLKTFS